MEEMPKETMMTAKYHAKMVHTKAGIITTTNAGLGMKVKVTDPEGKLIMDRMYGHKGNVFSHVLKVHYTVILKMYKIYLTCKNSKKDNSLSLLTLPVITKCASVQTKQPGQCLEVAWDPKNFASTFLSALVKTKTITR